MMLPVHELVFKIPVSELQLSEWGTVAVVEDVATIASKKTANIVEIAAIDSLVTSICLLLI